jgi:hypothetical protein
VAGYHTSATTRRQSSGAMLFSSSPSARMVAGNAAKADSEEGRDTIRFDDLRNSEFPIVAFGNLSITQRPDVHPPDR